MRARVANWIDPALCYRTLASLSSYGIWLDAGPYAQTGKSYVAVPEGEILSADVEAGTVHVRNVMSGHEDIIEATIFDVLRSRQAHDSSVGTSVAGETGFALGWVGWFGCELAAQTTGVPVAQAQTPDALFAFVNWALEFDHDTSTVSLLVLGTEEDLASRQEFLASVLAHGASVVSVRDASHESPGYKKALWRHDSEEYLTKINSCLEAISRGDAYQLCLTNTVTVETTDSPDEIYLRLRADNPSHHGGLLKLGEYALLSSSPEVFLSVSAAGGITTKPIKGTRARGLEEASDLAQIDDLVHSDKERAENLMIVDLMRNDLGRIAELGSVQVDSLLTVETYAHVHQLVSTVSGRLAEGLSSIDVIESCFPAGSMTGAPKISAMSILHQLEQGPRGVYSGAFGYIGLDGSVDLAMVIRSIVMSGTIATIGTGGGITAGSEPQSELEETWIKAEPLLRALGAVTNDYS